jgi:hypothetical protein
MKPIDQEKIPLADLVIMGTIATVDSSFSFKEAVAVIDNKIVFSGDKIIVQPYIGPKAVNVRIIS